MTDDVCADQSGYADQSARAESAARALAAATGVRHHDVAVVLGSGWSGAADAFGAPTADIPTDGIPGLRPPTAAGHAGRIRSVSLAGQQVLLFLGRTHLYEGHGVDAVVAAVRCAVKAGVRLVVLTNAAGGLRADMTRGQAVLISDQLNLTAGSPLVGADFADLTDLYSPRLRQLARAVDPSLAEGVYAQLPGPHFETPTEIRMLRTLGADLVGMSTGLEAIAARAAGAEVFGLSLVTNLAAGMTGEPLSAEEVLETGQSAASRLGRLLAELVKRTGDSEPFARPGPSAC